MSGNRIGRNKDHKRNHPERIAFPTPLHRGLMAPQRSSTRIQVLEPLLIQPSTIYGLFEALWKLKTYLEPMVNTVRAFSGDVKIKFGVQKCATVVLKISENVEGTCVRVPDG